MTLYFFTKSYHKTPKNPNKKQHKTQSKQHHTSTNIHKPTKQLRQQRTKTPNKKTPKKKTKVHNTITQKPTKQKNANKDKLVIRENKVIMQIISLCLF